MTQTENFSLPMCTAFAGDTCIASGSLQNIASSIKAFHDANPEAMILIFDDENCMPVEIDLRGSVNDVLQRISPDRDGPAKPGPGRPRLGVVSREIGLLPKHWDWLSLQPGGASVTLRKLVEEARRGSSEKDAVRRSQNAAYRFMVAMVGDRPHFEEAMRAFFSSDKALFVTLSAGWPDDLRGYALKVGEPALKSVIG